VIDASFRPRLAKKARLRFDKATDSYMLLYPERGMRLNQTASSILQLCDGALTIGAIVSSLAATYGRADDALAVEVNAFLQSLLDRGLIEWTTP